MYYRVLRIKHKARLTSNASLPAECVTTILYLLLTTYYYCFILTTHHRLTSNASLPAGCMLVPSSGGGSHSALFNAHGIKYLLDTWYLMLGT